MTRPGPREWFEIEVRLYGRSEWRLTTPLVGGIEDGFTTAEAAAAFIATMDGLDDTLYLGAEWRIVRCTRELVIPVRT